MVGSRAWQRAATPPAAASDVTAALALKAPLASPVFTGTPTGITKAHVGLGNVDNTADSAKPVSTAQAAINAAVQFTASYESPQQAIGGTLTLTHGLGVKPKLVLPVLVCAVAEFGYSVGDEAMLIPASGTTADRGLSVVPDATNINCRFGNATAALIISNKTNGNSVGLTNTSWRLIISAYA